VAKGKEERLVRRLEQRMVQATVQSFSGPLPPPEVLARYNDCIPNGATRIMEMAERQQEHRHTLERRVVSANTTDQRLGLILGFLLAVAIGAGGFWLILNGRDATGIASVITSIAGPTGAFIWGRRRQEKERSEKASSFPTFTR
jgi:uncharacterized membrane protein